MAVILSNQIGDLRGRIGNQVYSKNAHGSFVRTYVNPSQPNTIAQVRARSAFSSAITGYRTLSSKNKALWQEYANNHFIPKKRGYTKGYSGFDAYVSLHAAAQNGLSLPIDYDILINGSPPSGNITKHSFLPPATQPPITSFVNFSKESGTIEQALPWWIKEAEIVEDGSFSFKIILSSGIGRTLDQNLDWYGERIGYVMYMSNGNPSDNMSYKKPMQYCLGYMSPWTTDTPDPDLVNVEDVQIDSVTNINPGDYNEFPLQGEYVLLTLYFISSRGQLVKVGTLERQVQNV